MDENRLLTNSNRSDRLLRVKLKILKRTIRVRGVECTVIKTTNDVFNIVHGYNNFDLDGDRSNESTSKSVKLVLNLNMLEHVGEKSNSTQTVETTEDIADEGDIILYRSRKYEYAFRVSRKSTYGELDFLYEYDLEHFRTIEIGKDTEHKVIYYKKDIEKYFIDHNADQAEGTIDTSPDWTERIDELDRI